MSTIMIMDYQHDSSIVKTKTGKTHSVKWGNTKCSEAKPGDKAVISKGIMIDYNPTIL